MKTDADSPISILRFLAGLILSPLLTALLVIVPPLILGAEYLLLYIAINYALFTSYLVSLFIGLPIVVFLDARQKCTFKNMAISGFIVGFIVFFTFLASVSISSNTFISYSLGKIIDVIMHASWYGISAAAGAILFALISGITHRYNKALNVDAEKAPRQLA